MYCRLGGGFRISPYLQELYVYAGHLGVYLRSSEILEKFLRVPANSSQVFRVTSHFGESLGPLLYRSAPSATIADDEVVYAELDGSMILTDEQWREVKLGRVFTSDAIVENGQRRSHSIEHSTYTAHLGGHEEFCRRFATSTDRYAHLGDRLVFLSDGARWIEQWTSTRYPQATQILDYYHAVEYLCDFAAASFPEAEERRRWIASQKALLLAGRTQRVIRQIEALAKDDPSLSDAAERITRYYRANIRRMRYDEYTRRGLYIGSGAIESAHRTVVQSRMKLSGQRWSVDGAEHMLNLRVCAMSGRWQLLEGLVRGAAPQVETAAL